MAGESPNGWKQVTLGELGEVNRGRSRHRPRYAEHLYGGPYPFVQTGDIKQSGGKITSFEQTYSEAGLAQSRLWPAGTMAITIAANIAETAILTFPACFPDSVVGFIADETKCDVRFIEYTFRNLKRQIQHEATGSVQDNINLGTLQRLYFPLPDLPKQRAIASILGALDDKIELNRRMNATLESLARAIFKSWFVDFDPVRMKAEGRSQKAEEKSSFSLPPSTLKLFPSTFQDSELGEIPTGWMKTTIGKEVNFQTGFAFKSKEFTNEPPGTRLARGMNVKEGVFYWGDQSRYWPEVTSDVEQYLLKQGDVLIGMDGSKVGKNWVRVRDADLPCLLVQRVARLRAANSVGENFLWIFIGSDAFRGYVDGVKTGTSIPHISGGQIKKLDFVRPPIGDNRIFHAFEKLVAPFAEQHDANVAESLTLSTLRDTLLPRLLSGELPVPAALTTSEVG